ncbi:MAG: hypothetical protein Q7R66_21250 [Undibacterium sp.]|uniref:hypothetical protein n=1 Tax=Undibacterium sp. TaxID=1914977 RepID=UPI0027171AA4|nr:hypothetical protein [Undibacterium sp.]MDO8654707.1 hypothetical protein [Undibacterium sp.]
MNTLSSLGNSHFLPQKMADVLAALNAGSSQSSPVDSLTAVASTLQPPAVAAKDDVVTLSDAGIALAKRASDLGNATINAAQSLLSSFAQQLFGDAAQGMKISFDKVSISAMAGFSAAVQHSSGANGSSDVAALSVQESSDFVGKGQITTADGHRYNFEVEVHYQAMAQTAVATSTTANAPVQDQSLEVTKTPSSSMQGLKAHFPGTVADLFKMLDQGKLNILFQLPSPGEGADTGEGKAQNGHLTLRLLELIDHPHDSAQPNVKKLAHAYGLPAETSDSTTTSPVRNNKALALPVVNAGAETRTDSELETAKQNSAASA